MGKKTIFLSASLCLILILTASAYACFIVPEPYFDIKSEQYNCLFKTYNDTLNETTDVNAFIENATAGYRGCTNMSLSTEDQERFKDIINKFNKEWRYDTQGIDILQQTDAEYQAFLKNATEINKDICVCTFYNNITREGNWTAYLKTNDCTDYDFNVNMCEPGPPASCKLHPSRSLFSRILAALKELLPFV